MFYTTIISEAPAIFAYENADAAYEKFHTELAYAINQKISITCIVMDNHGAIYKSEEYKGLQV